MSQPPPGAAIDSLPSAAMWSLRRASSIEIWIPAAPPVMVRAASTRSMIDSIGIAAYQTWSARIPAYRRIQRRYCQATTRAMSRLVSSVKPFSREATTTLAARRLRSHSHGPMDVSSKSLRSNTSRRSGLANTPKLARCASPQSWTLEPLTGDPARSAAMTAADPRRNANGEAIIRPNRIGTSSGIRPSLEASRVLMTSGRSWLGAQSAWLRLGAFARSPRPRSSESDGGAVRGEGLGRVVDHAGTSIARGSCR